MGAQGSGGIFYMFQGIGIGNPDVLIKVALNTRSLQARSNLWPGTVNQYQSHAQALQQSDIVDDIGEVFVLRDLTPQHQHEGLTPVQVDVGCGISEPADVGPAWRSHLVSQVIDY